jgi:hypothetical protein
LDLGDARVVDHDVEPAEFLFGMIVGGVDVATLRNVGFERRRLATRALTSSATPCILASLTSTIAMSAPSLASLKAMARPMPWPAPVTSATFPPILMLISLVTVTKRLIHFCIYQRQALLPAVGIAWKVAC